MRRSTTTALAVASLALAAAACGRPEDQETGSITSEDVREARAQLAPGVVEALDSGNAAYRAKDYQEALTQYRRVIELEEDLPAGWFGVYMAELALGNVEAANRAMERAQSLAPGSTLIHPETGTGDTARQPAEDAAP